MNISLTPNSIIPLHTQLLNQIRHLVLSGQWSPGSRIPSETELQRELNISRSTVRQAFNKAETEGLIERVPGKGTFVTLTPAIGSVQRLIGYVTASLPSSTFSYRVLFGAERAARDRGYRILFCASNKNINEENRLLDQLLADKVGGILIWPVMSEDPSRRLCQVANQGLVPVVTIDRTLPNLQCDHVAGNNYSGAYKAVQHLIELGHQCIVFLTHEPLLQLSPVVERFRGYREALQDAHLVPLEPWLVEVDTQEFSFKYTWNVYQHNASQEVQQIMQLLETSPTPTAIFAVNDLWAMQTLMAAKLAGLRVPDDISIVGFDNIDTAAQLEVPLTTVMQDSYAMGKRAAELLFERIEGYDGFRRQEMLTTQLVIRASTASPTTSLDSEKRSPSPNDLASSGKAGAA